MSDLAESIADFVQARRVREEVLEICNQWLGDNPPAAGSPRANISVILPESRYWLLATVAEAHIGLEDGLGPKRLEEAFAAAPEEWMKQSTQEQVGKLKALLASSPLKKLPIALAQS